MKIYPKLSLADGADFTAPFPKVGLDKAYADIFIGLGGAGVDVLAALKNAGLTVTQTRAKEDWRCVAARRS